MYEENFITCNWWDNCICGGNEGLAPGLSAEELLNYFSRSSKFRNRLQNLNEY